MNVEEMPLVAWSGPAWRVHGKRCAADDPGGSLRRSGRFNRAPDMFNEDEYWPALYLSLAPEVSLAEIIRNTDPAMMPRLNTCRITELEIKLQAVLDFRNPDEEAIDPGALLNSRDYSVAHDLAQRARVAGAIIVPSATQIGDNLVIFPDLIRSGSSLEIVSSRDPMHYVERS